MQESSDSATSSLHYDQISVFCMLYITKKGLMHNFSHDCTVLKSCTSMHM